MNIDTAFKSNYLKAADFEEDKNVTIRGVEIESLGQGADAEDKPVVYFDELERGLVLNVTNKNTIKGLYGPDTDEWVGKKITLYSTEVAFGGQMTLSIRVRMKAPPTAAPSIAKTLTAKSEANAQTGVPPTPSRACWDLYVNMVDQHCQGDPADAYSADEKKEVFAKILTSLFPEKTMKTMTPQDWTAAQESIVERFSPAQRDILPF